MNAGKPDTDMSELQPPEGVARELSHVDSAGNFRMVDIGDKPFSTRSAFAKSFPT